MNQKLSIAIIQITRIGDLIQTVQAARQLRTENPDIELTLFARKKFAKGIQFLLETVFEHIVLFETKDFFTDSKLSSAKKEVSYFFQSINSKQYDFCINLSFDKSSSYFTSLLNAKEKIGIHRSYTSKVVINDNWSQYVYSNVLNNTENPFSLVDIYKYIMGVQSTHILKDDYSSSPRDNNVVIHPFASQRKKKWGISKWSELIYKLAKEHPDFNFHIVGSTEDMEEANRLNNAPSLLNIQKRIHIHCGDYKISDTYELLTNAKLFIGHDSMVSHLAAETLTPSVIISLGTVRPHETTPYSDKVINIIPKNDCFPCSLQKKCELLPCHSSINHQLVSTLGAQILKGEEVTGEFLKEKLTPFHLGSCLIYSTSFDENGLQYHDLLNDYKTARSVFMDYYKIIWQYYLRDCETNTTLPQISPITAKHLHQYLDGTNYLFEIYNFGSKYSNKLTSAVSSPKLDMNEVQEYITKLNEVDELSTVTKNSYPLLKGFVDYFYVNKANASGDNLVDISKSNLLNYYDASNLVAALSDFIEKSISPHSVVTSSNKEV